MTTLRFLNGTKTIGGNIIEIANGDSRVIMDFGVAADLTGETVTQAIEQHKLPNLPDLLLPDQTTKFKHQAIFISHLHLDHMGALRYLQNHDVPIYMSADGLKLYQLLMDQGVEPRVTNLHPLTDQETIQVGSLKVTGFLSDHDVIAPMALLIDDGQHKFLHSGDVRIGGYHQDRVTRWSDLVKNQLDVYLTEATTYSFVSEQPQMVAGDHHEPILVEQDLPQRLTDKIRTTEQVIAVNPYPRNVERLIRFNEAAAAAGRPMIWEPDYAQLVRAFAPAQQINEISERPANEAPKNTTYYTWSDLADQLVKNPRQFTLQNSWANHQRLQTFKGGLYLHANGEPLGDYDPRFAELQNFLAENHWTMESCGASGHAKREDILALAAKINARRTVAWHSFKPELLAADLKKTKTEPWLPELDLYYRFD